MIARKKIKIAHLVLSLELGGLEKLVVEFLKGLDRETFDIVLGCLEGPGALAGEVTGMGISITTFGRKEGIDLGLVPKIARWLRENRVDILHTHNSAAHFYGSLAGRPGRVGSIVHTKHGRDWPDKPRKVFLNRISSLFSSKIVTVSENAREVAVKIEKVPERKLLTIHNGIDTDKYTGEGTGSFPLQDVGENDLVVGTVARLSSEKDQKTLLRAFADLHDRRPGTHLVIAGDGPEREELERYASSLPCGNKVKFLGAITDVASLLRRLDVFVLTSTSEGISLALLEAGASGVPSVVTDAGGNAEVVVDGEGGFVVPPRQPEKVAEKIELLLADPSLRRRAGEKARDRVVKHFSLQGMIAKYEELYKECINRKKG